MIKKQIKVSNKIMLGIWEINEPLDRLEAQYHAKELERIAHYHPTKKAEHIASRQLIESMCQGLDIPFHGICKDDHGKPHLIDSPYHISISHSYPKIVALINLERPAGIDIEKPREQLLRVKRKFLNEEELAACNDNLDKLCSYWCAKESIYKIHGRKNLSFVQNIKIQKIKDSQVLCTVHRDGQQEDIILNLQKEDEYIITYNL
ncbi:hypothetical protein BFP72_02950 [Reichenbachiella sp. 5M10]|uniref:4'-phosphopantetheinyl transferase family protein n=1 Tax=Reichenbachiella sp. 5M10 TaxID=1889772 RepID=UPI000C689EE2|nr:4'-phosphopantetheinyl transferase superfamily protein [Reichenbachiella sp. 5M10]PIB34448.1 hypothetical protein BFP72_02950 [Reichenbachiella sp. 5M10]